MDIFQHLVFFHYLMQIYYLILIEIILDVTSYYVQSINQVTRNSVGTMDKFLFIQLFSFLQPKLDSIRLVFIRLYSLAIKNILVELIY